MSVRNKIYYTDGVTCSEPYNIYQDSYLLFIVWYNKPQEHCNKLKVQYNIQLKPYYKQKELYNER